MDTFLSLKLELESTKIKSIIKHIYAYAFYFELNFIEDIILLDF